jgi:hypothetical protein
MGLPGIRVLILMVPVGMREIPTIGTDKIPFID